MNVLKDEDSDLKGIYLLISVISLVNFSTLYTFEIIFQNLSSFIKKYLAI